MNNDSQENKKGTKPQFIGPCGEYNCSICVFTKSQAPGDPYDLSNCPKYLSKNMKKKEGVVKSSKIES